MYAYGYVCVCACMYTLTHSLILSLSPAYTGCKPRHRRRGLEESATLRLRTPHHTRRTCSHTTPGTLERGVERGDSEREVRPHLVQGLRSWRRRRRQYRSGPPGTQPPQKPSKRHTPLGHELAIWSRYTWARRRGHQTLWEHARGHEVAQFRSLCHSRKGEPEDGEVMKVVASSCLRDFYFIVFFILFYCIFGKVVASSCLQGFMSGVCIRCVSCVHRVCTGCVKNRNGWCCMQCSYLWCASMHAYACVHTQHTGVPPCMHVYTQHTQHSARAHTHTHTHRIHAPASTDAW